MADNNLLIATGIYPPDPGGPATYLHEVLPELQRRGWRPQVLTFSDTMANRGESFPVVRIPRRLYPLRMGHYAASSLPLVGWAKVVYVHQLGLPLIGSRNAPRVVKIVGDLSWERGVRRGWVSPKEDIDLFQKRTRHDLRVGFDRDRLNSEARSYHSVIVPSEYLKRMVAGWGVDDAKIQVIYNALPSHYKASNLSQVEARKELDLDPDQPLLLTVGRMLPWKGVDHLIAALAQIPEVKLVAAGDGPALAQAQREAAAAGLSERVTFLGSVPRGQVPLWMKAADYVALYSGYEGLSHVLLESLRAGTPVIASDKGGNPEVIAHGVNGLLVPYVNRDALIAALREAFQPGRREALAANTAAGMERFMFGNMIAATDAELRRWV